MKDRMKNKENYRVLIVDDHAALRHGLAALINEEPDLEVTGQAEGVSKALQILEEADPDLAIVDITLKDGNGLELIEQIRARNSSIKILVSSMHDEYLYTDRALRAGAQGYINKAEALDQFISAIRQVLTGGIYLSPPMAERMLHHMVGLGQAVPAQASIESLSNRELEVFELIGKGLATRQIAENLHLSVKTIESHRENIKKKLMLQSNPELVRRSVQWVLEQGK